MGKRQLWHLNGINLQKRLFWKQVFQEMLMLWNQFHVKISCVVKFPFQTWCVVKWCFKIWHAVELRIQKMTSCIKLTKSWLILKFLIRIWRFVKNFFQNQIFFQTFDRVTVFFYFFKQLLFFEKTHSCQSWLFWGQNDPEVIVWKQNFHQTLFFL